MLPVIAFKSTRVFPNFEINSFLNELDAITLREQYYYNSQRVVLLSDIQNRQLFSAESFTILKFILNQFAKEITLRERVVYCQTFNVTSCYSHIQQNRSQIYKFEINQCYVNLQSKQLSESISTICQLMLQVSPLKSCYYLIIFPY